MDDIIRPWTTSSGHGRHHQAMDDIIRPWTTSSGHGRHHGVQNALRAKRAIHLLRGPPWSFVFAVVNAFLRAGGHTPALTNLTRPSRNMPEGITMAFFVAG
jgi:hypothetical protein